ncbi:hypothetical protein PM082_022994 [Marasmius tenuissimus]|nr:hypothetical protein PM082_022994 [Marasmius tenuissimus]
MALGKRKRTGIDRFLDLTAFEDGDNDYDEGESEVEEHFEDSDDDVENDPALNHARLSFEAPEDRQSFVDALCDDLTARYVREPQLQPTAGSSGMRQLSKEPSRLQQTIDPSLLNQSSEFQPTAGQSRRTASPSLSPAPQSSIFLPLISEPPSLPSPPSFEPSSQPTFQQQRGTPLFLPSPTPEPAQKRQVNRVKEPQSDAQGFYSWASQHSPVYRSIPNQSSTSENAFEIPEVEKMGDWERIHTLRRNAEAANIPTIDRDHIREMKKHACSALSTRLRAHVQPLEWVTICSGMYRGDVGFALHIPADEKDDEEAREAEEILQNKLKYNHAKKQRHEQQKDIDQMEDEQRELVYKLRGEELGKGLQEVEHLSRKRNEFDVMLVPRLPLSKLEKSEQRKEHDIIHPFVNETDGSSPRRNPPRLFNPKEYDNVETDDVGYRYRGSFFAREGLLVATYRKKDLTLATSIPHKLEKAFRQANCPTYDIFPFPYPSSWSFDEGEDVIWTDAGSPTASNGAPQRGMNVTFKYMVIRARASDPPTAIVSMKVDAEQVLKPTAGPFAFPHPANETPQESWLRERREEEMRREQRRLQEVVSKGEHVAQVRHLLKTHKKDDWIIIMTGKDRGKYGRVLIRYENILTVLLPEEHALATCHVNTAKRMSPPLEKDSRLDIFGRKRDLIPAPWIDTEVRVTRGPYNGCVGRVEMVERVEGKFGRRLMVGLWVELVKRFVLVDHDHILTTHKAQRLRDAHPLSDLQIQVYGISRSMSTSREPWLGTHVRITKGHFKGQFGKVRGVNVIFQTDDLQRDRKVPGKTIAKRKGIQLRIELDTQMAVSTGLVTVDYLRVLDVKSRQFLNQAYPVKSGGFYDYRPGLEDLPVIAEKLDHLEVPSTPQWSREEMLRMRFDTTLDTHWDPYASTTCPAGTFGPDAVLWSPTSPPAIPTEPSVTPPDIEPLNPSEQVPAQMLQELCLEASRIANGEESIEETTTQHWILHPNLVGMKVQAAVAGEDKYVDIVRKDSRVLAVKSDSNHETIYNPISIQHAREPIKPSTEKNLMVVVGGDPEHIGKLVRRLSNFYLGSKSEENHWIIVNVIKRTSPTAEESLTPERLELDPKTMLARVYESRKRRTAADEYMKLTRKAILAGNRRVVPIRPLP